MEGLKSTDIDEALSTGLTLVLASLLAALLLPLSSANDGANDGAAERSVFAVLNPVALAKLIEREAASLQIKLCDNHGVCDNSLEMLAENNLQLPKISTEDRCFSLGFQKDKCLNKIHRDLSIFKIYLVHVKETFISEKNTVESLQYKTQILAGAIKKMMKRTETESDDKGTNIQVLQALKSENLWRQRVTNRLILQAFIECIQKTARAVRYIGTFHGGNKIGA
ncbi:hypothetical protein XENTR_v10016113 [Xenopus tropicalis]|nr:hypothetical protein XENTR_v10016113 [Xenopus tropicalis]